MVGEFLGFLGGHLAVVRHVALVADEHLVDVLAGVPVDLLQPLLHVREGLLVRHVVDHNDPMRAPVVARGDRPEPLLPRSVPDLQLHGRAPEVERPDLEVDADGADEGLCEGVVCESEE
uniref:Uncharacterized protein n=1 Tax=Arcella intermedia TaxID=1963864 RepID=A0A6B2LLP1_9EUKA